MIRFAKRQAFQFYSDGTETKSIDMIEAYGLSTDTKPVDGVANGSCFIEMDTRKIFLFDEENKRWLLFSGGDE